MKDEIMNVINKAEKEMTVTDVKKQLQYDAVKIAYGVSHFTISDIRKAIQELIESGQVEKKEIEATFPAYKKKE